MSAPSTVHLELIRHDIRELLRNTEGERAGVEVKIVLASLSSPDDEGVTRLREGDLAAWCAMPGKPPATDEFLQMRIDRLIRAGVLAPGSTPTELVSMIGRAGRPKTARGRRGRRGGKGQATTATETTTETEEVAA